MINIKNISNMEELKKLFELNAKVDGVGPMEYMAKLLEKNERQEIEIERGKMSVSILKQMNNRSRLLIDTAKVALKKMEVESKARQGESASS